MMPSDAAPAGDAWQTERRWLGYAGLAPFLACAAVLLLADEPAWRRVAMDTLRNYAAVIASFLGAVHWGIRAGLAKRSIEEIDGEIRLKPAAVRRWTARFEGNLAWMERDVGHRIDEVVRLARDWQPALGSRPPRRRSGGRG